MGCGPASTKPTTAPPSSGKRVWAVLPAESDAYPIAARAATERMRRARVRGLEEPQFSKVSLEVVQLSIECTDRSADCYEAVGRSLAANELLFTEIDEGPKKNSIKVTVTLFDVDAKKRKKAAIKVFASEEDVVWGVADVIAEATK
ncbi:hypothetical protein BH11MYX3_BH11MYX3_45820 [soil metagenome]